MNASKENLTNNKPEIICYDFGKHNEDLEKTRSRLIEGGSWKHQRIVLLIPSAKLIPAKVTLSWMNLIWPPNQQVFRMMMLGQEVGEAYTNAIEYVLNHPELSKWEYILTIEHDNIPPPDGILKLIEDMEKYPQYACIGGLYYTKGEGGVAQIWGDIKDPVINFRPQPPKIGEIIETYGTGMGFNLWRISMFKDQKLRRPWFKTRAGIDGTGTQDLTFWSDAKKYGYRCAIDCRIPVGHHDPKTDITW